MKKIFAIMRTNQILFVSLQYKIIPKCLTIKVSDMKTKRQAIKEVKDAIKNNLLCGNAYYCVVFNHNEEDYMIVDEYSINDEIMSDEHLQMLKSKQRQITEITFWDGACYPHEDETIYKAA